MPVSGTAATAGIIGRRRKTRARRGAPRPQPRVTPIAVLNVTAAASTLTIDFDQAVMVRGVPRYTTDLAGPTPLSAAPLSPTSVAVTFDAAIATATSVTIPFEDPAVRNTAGGYVMPSAALPLA